MPNGSCLCGAVTLSVAGELRPADACHCGQCRKQSGHYWASTNVPKAALTVTGEDRLNWYYASPKVRRGFCSVCGSFLLWDSTVHDVIAVAMGAFDKPTGTQLAKHIFVDFKGDYYELADGLPQLGTE